MLLLASLKPIDYRRPTHCYGALVEIDWDERQVTRCLRVPTASFQDDLAFMAPLANGIARVGDRVFLAMWNFLVEIDLPSFTVVNSVTDPWMADLHGMATDGERLWVASTASECVLTIDLATFEVVDRWGPDAPILATPWPGTPPEPVVTAAAPPSSGLRSSLTGAARRARRGSGRGRDGSDEHRYVHKTRSPHWHHHLNDVRFHDGALYVFTQRWFQRGVGGAVIRLDPETGAAEFLAPPGSFLGTHDGEFVDGSLYVTESASNSVGWIDASGAIHHRQIEPAGSYVRGLCRTDTGFVVGCSSERGQDHPSSLVEYDASFTEQRASMVLDGPYPTDQGTAVHSLLRLDAE